MGLGVPEGKILAVELFGFAEKYGGKVIHIEHILMYLFLNSVEKK